MFGVETKQDRKPTSQHLRLIGGNTRPFKRILKEILLIKPNCKLWSTIVWLYRLL